MSNTQAENLQNSTKEQIGELMQETKQSYEALLSACQTLQKSMEEDKRSFIERVNVLLNKVAALNESLQSKQDEMMAQMRIAQESNEKKIDKLGKLAIGGLIGTIVTIVLLVVSLVI